MIPLLFFLFTGLINGIAVEDIDMVMPIYVQPEYRDGYYIVTLIVLKEGIDIPGELAYYSVLYDRIVIEKQGLKPANYYGTCFSTLWHEILHARWNGTSEEDHLRMILEKQCA